tara:strand:- start:906 stop:1022 length:117 start_codon:yes stop_codon:yes gene_type:complete
MAKGKYKKSKKSVKRAKKGSKKKVKAGSWGMTGVGVRK